MIQEQEYDQLRDEIQRLRDAHLANAAFWMVYPDKKETPEVIRDHQREFRLTLPGCFVATGMTFRLPFPAAALAMLVSSTMHELAVLARAGAKRGTLEQRTALATKLIGA